MNLEQLLISIAEEFEWKYDGVSYIGSYFSNSSSFIYRFYPKVEGGMGHGDMEPWERLGLIPDPYRHLIYIKSNANDPTILRLRRHHYDLHDEINLHDPGSVDKLKQFFQNSMDEYVKSKGLICVIITNAKRQLLAMTTKLGEVVNFLISLKNSTTERSKSK